MPKPAANLAQHRLRRRLRPYRGGRGNSGVSAYGIGRDFIIIEFRDEHAYLYNFTQPGQADVAAMTQLAVAGRGLATYINQHVRKNYTRQLW